MTQEHIVSAGPADADAGNWVDRYAPATARPYLRLIRADRPVGVWLLVLPCWMGQAAALADAATPDGARALWPTALWHAVLFAIGAFVMRGAGCAYNDIVDRDFDARVERTARRPIPAGQISVRRAVAVLVALSLAGLAVLVQFNPFTILLGASSLLLVAAYPFMKRITWWPQAWLGLTFNWGALVGYAATTGTLTPAAFLLYAAGIAWTLGYDTIYACQDMEDDALIGVKSSARALGAKARPAVAGFYAGTVALLIAAGLAAGWSPLYFAALIATAAHFAWQARAFNPSDSAGCLRIFKSNRDAGLLMVAALLLEAAAASG